MRKLFVRRNVDRYGHQEDIVISTRGQEPASQAQVDTPPALKNVVVVIRGEKKLDAELIKLACSVARPKQSRILALYGIEVPRAQKIEATMPAEEARASDALQFATTIAERCDYDIEPEMVQTRSFAHSIVEEANQQGCTLLIMGVPYQEKHVMSCPIDETIDYVLQNATCRVWLIRGSKETAHPQC